MSGLDWDQPQDSDESETVADPAVAAPTIEAAQMERYFDSRAEYQEHHVPQVHRLPHQQADRLNCGSCSLQQLLAVHDGRQAR
jgi:hypothetical protein